MARKKKAPVVRNIINDTPNTYRAINRMNGIVTMIEYTGEDDIKAYELEPTYQEIGGGGSSLVNPILTCTLVLSEGDTTVSYLGYEDNTVTNYARWSITGGDTNTLTVLVPYDPYDECYEWWFTEINGDSRTKTVTNEINCSVVIDSNNAYAIVTDPTQPASFTLTLS